MEQKERIPLPQASVSRLNSPGHRILGDQELHAQKSRSFSKSLRPKQKNFIGTLNTNTLSKVGKLKQLTNTMEKFHIKILAIQETRFTDENHFDSGNFRIYKGKPAVHLNKGPKQFGTAFVVHKSIIDSIINFHSTSERMSTITLKSGNKAYTLINAHAPTNDYNRKDPQVIDDFWELLEETSNKIPAHHVKILLGDFNGQLGKEKKFRKTTGIHTAHKRTNKNGERLINFCENFDLKVMSTQFLKPVNKLTTWKSPNSTLGEFQIDHVAISNKNTKEILNIRTRKGFFESDHHLLQIKIRFQPNRKKPQMNKTIRIDPEYLKLNEREILQEIRQSNATNWQELAEVLKNTMKLGKPPRKRKHRWWNSACDQAIEERIQAWKTFSSNKTTEKWQEFQRIQKSSSKAIRREKRRYDINRLKEIEQEFTKNNTRNFYKFFKENLTGYQPPNLCFRRPDGSLETNSRNNCQMLAKYFHSLLNCEPPLEQLDFEKPPSNPDSKPPSLREVKEIINSLKNNKSPGEDGIIAEIWKLNDNNLTQTTHRIISKIWETEQIPAEWKCALIHPLHKKGAKTDPNNYRGISLLPVIYKILSKALLSRLEEQADQLIGEYQAGFRKGRSCSEQIWNLKTILQMRRCRNTVVTFVDFKKAYDSIDRQTLFHTLEEFGIDRKTRSIIQQALTGTTSKVKFMGEISEAFHIHTGVRQGDGLSPLLFNMVLEKIVRTWENEIKGIQLGIKKEQRIRVKCLAFADDLAILSNNREEARLALEKLHEISQKTGLQISYEKTQYIENKPADNLPITTQYGKVAQVSDFRYLGEIIQPSGLNSRANQERISRLQKAYKLTWNHYNKKSISVNAKLRHYKTVVLPEALYAAETTVIHGHTKIREIEKQERKILRKIYGPVFREGIWIKRPTREIYKEIETITDTIRKRRMKFYGHVSRMNQNRLTRRIFEIASKSKNKTKWITETEADIKELGITQDNLNNREQFRNIIQKHTLKQEHTKNRIGKKWSEERKREHSERMKRIWEERRKKKS